jgi:hypothetical protein
MAVHDFSPGSFPLALAFLRQARARQKLIRYALKRRTDDDDAFLVGGPKDDLANLANAFGRGQ